jgi:hypothetical protein
MSVCYFCDKEKVYNPFGGQCSTCSTPVCLPPPRRKDKRFHGERCRCGCQKPFCKPHLSSHAIYTERKSDPSDCFPETSGALGGGTLRTTLQLLSRGNAFQQPDAMTAEDLSDFLNTITPGNTALLAELAGHGDRQWEVDRERWDVADEGFVAFAPSFFTRDRTAHIFNLAASTLGNIFLAYGEGARSMVDDEHIAQALPGLAAWVESKAAWRLAEAIQNLLGNIAPNISYSTVGNSFELDLPPGSAAERVRWISEAKIAQPMKSAFMGA